MKTFLLLLIFFSGSNCFASSQFEVLKERFSTCLTLTEFVDKLDSPFSDFKISRANDRLTRKLDFGFSQIVYEIQISYNLNNVKDFRAFLVINSNDSIVLGNLQELDYYSNIKKTETYIISHQQISNYLSQHTNLYSLELSENEYINQLTELNIYGFGCSESGMFYPTEAEKMMDLVEHKNYEKLAEWLRQINPELQAYAVDGLTQLSKKGIPIKEEDFDLIQHLIKRNSKIYHCSGCIFGISTTISEIIKWREN